MDLIRRNKTDSVRQILKKDRSMKLHGESYDCLKGRRKGLDERY